MDSQRFYRKACYYLFGIPVYKDDEMKKFLVGNSIGGAQITKKAWDYLVANMTKNMDHDDYRMSKEIMSAEWHAYFEKHGAKDLYGDYVRFHPWLDGSDKFRQIVLNLVEELHYDYKKLDKLNDNHDLRIITIPDDGIEYQITEDPECGAEYVTQVHRNHVVKDDWYERAKYLIKDFCNTHEDLDKITYVVELDKVRLVFEGDYAMAECKDPEDKKNYFLLKKNEYYIGTDEHPKISYDILNDPNALNYFGGMYRDTFKEEAMKAYCSLYERIK